MFLRSVGWWAWLVALASLVQAHDDLLTHTRTPAGHLPAPFEKSFFPDMIGMKDPKFLSDLVPPVLPLDGDPTSTIKPKIRPQEFPPVPEKIATTPKNATTPKTTSPLSVSTDGLLRGAPAKPQSFGFLGITSGGEELSGKTLSLEDLQHAALALGLAYSFLPAKELDAEETFGLDVLTHSKKFQKTYSKYQSLQWFEEDVGVGRSSYQ